nr:immunoglobulin light chain junction region [Macaca mulatta]
CMQALEFPLPF